MPLDSTLAALTNQYLACSASWRRKAVLARAVWLDWLEAHEQDARIPKNFTISSQSPSLRLATDWDPRSGSQAAAPT